MRVYNICYNITRTLVSETLNFCQLPYLPIVDTISDPLIESNSIVVYWISIFFLNYSSSEDK